MSSSYLINLRFFRYSKLRKNTLLLYVMTTTNHWHLLEKTELPTGFLLENPAQLWALSHSAHWLKCIIQWYLTIITWWKTSLILAIQRSELSAMDRRPEGDLLRPKGGLWSHLTMQIRPNLNGFQWFHRRTTRFPLPNKAFCDLVARIEIQECNLQPPFNRRRRTSAFNRRHRILATESFRNRRSCSD